MEFIASLGDMTFSVIMIVNKLHRMEGDPQHADNIDDIVGYGKCAREALDGMKAAHAESIAGPWTPTPEQVKLAAMEARMAAAGVGFEDPAKRLASQRDAIKDPSGPSH